MTKYQQAVKCKWNYVVGSTEVSIRREGAVLRLSFKGSTGNMNPFTGLSQDWKDNINFIKKQANKVYPYRNMKEKWRVHQGLLLKYKLVNDYILETARNGIANGVEKIEVYGFSQGAFLAILCHEDISFHFGTPVETWAFEPPRGFGLILPKKLKQRLKNIHVYIIKNDLVPKLPPWILGYRHVGEKNYLEKKYWAWPWNWEKIHMSCGEYSI